MDIQKLTISQDKVSAFQPECDDQSFTLFDGDLASYWEPCWTVSNGENPRIADVDLGEAYYIGSIKVYDFQGVGNLQVLGKQANGDWVLLVDYNTAAYEEWVSFNVEAVYQSLRFKQIGNGCKITQVEIWGAIEEVVTPTPDPDPDPTPDPTPSAITANILSLNDISAVIGLSGLSPETSYELKVNDQVVEGGSFTTSPEGTVTPDPEPDPTPDPAPSPIEPISFNTLDDFIGTNVLADDPPHLVEPVAGNVRVYQWLKWTQGDVSNVNLSAPLSDIKINFNPNDAFGFNHDESTRQFSEIGTTYITLFESAMYLTGNDKTKLNAVAFKMSDGRDGLDQPHRWKYVSHLYFQFAARYGQTEVDESKLITDSEKISGLGYCQYIEGGNEKDRWWIGRDKADLSPEEHAAYYSAVADGHMNTMSESGVFFGAKNADPNIKLMLGGLAFVDFDELLATGKVDWFERFFGWFEQNRTDPQYETYPIDVICYHDYPNTERKQRNLSGKGLDPETYNWYEKTKAFVEYIRNRCPKPLEVDNNEFGYDRNQSSPQRAEPYAGFSAEQVAGFWTIRCMLEGWAAGLTRGVQFYFRENGGNGGGIFQTSGLTDKSNGYSPFQMYYYMATTRAAMAGHDFVSREVIGDMIKYTTVHRETGKKGYILWHFSKSGQQSTYNLSVSAAAIAETKLKDNSLTGDKTTKSANNGVVSVSVSEMPTFITEI